MITLISTPEYIDPVSPSIISRWVATECPNNFRLLRRDYLVNSCAEDTGLLTVDITTFTGIVTDSVSLYDLTTNSMYKGLVTDITGTTITTDIPWVAGMDIQYLNENTEFDGYYFEGRLTVNGVLESLTIIASPDSFGYADLDVSGILRIKTSLGKVGDYSTTLMKETTKSGSFSFEYRGCWYGSNEPWIPEGGSISPPSPTITWYYAESIRSEEQGSNLHEYVVTPIDDAPFFNLFEQPVYFLGLPFDISFILPEFTEVSPTVDLTVTTKVFNSSNTQIGADVVTNVPADSLEGFVNSLNIDMTTIPANAAYFTVEISIP